MPDAHIRCKFFDDDGNPIGTGCRFGHKCRYVHPTDTDWSFATPHRGRATSDRPKNNRQGPTTDLGYSRPTSSHSEMQTQQDGGPLSGRSKWTASPTRTHQSSGSFSNSAGSGWGSSAWSNEPGPSSKPSEAPQQSLLGGWDSETAWDTSTKDSTSWNWGVPAQDSTSNGGSRAGSSSNPWGAWGTDTVQQSNVRTDEPKVPSFSQSTMNSPSILSATPVLSRLQKSGDRRGLTVDTSKRPSSPHKSTSDTISPSAHSTPRTPQDSEMRDNMLLASSSAPAPAARKFPLPTRIRPPLPTRLKQTSIATPSVVETTGNKPPPTPLSAPQDWTEIPLSSSITGRINQDDLASDASGSISQLATRDPMELHAKLIKEMMNAVSIRYRLLKAEDKKVKWREARASQCYQHSTPAAQKKLESTNQLYSEELGKLTKQLNSSLKMAVQYSDALNVHRDLIAKGLDTKKIILYTDELRDWVADLELPKRIFTARALVQQEKEQRDAFKRQKQEKVDTLRNSIYELELKATDIWDDFCHLQYIQPQRFREEFTIAKNAMEVENPGDTPDLEKMFADLGVGKERVEVVSNKTRALDGSLNEYMPKAQELQEQVKALEEEIADLRKKDQEIKAFRQTADAEIVQLEQWKTDDKQRLDQLSQQIEGLHKLPRPAPPPSINVDGLSPYINELVTAYVAKDIKPALDAIAEACERDVQLVKAEFDKLVEQVVVKTYDLVQMILRAHGWVPQIVPQPA
ncbi:hypothetical protein P691DRAFT_770908 [Macrolepiota fuliginosa MF-IS2]|uniref:C3H1-type domain-containing protein n=1 Tax=Macrolepiota fuliginosa MF-IS2 TaxID=1400762 RepID=A0A9P6CAJ5_9AGAR|nr:hypothetical protein P691DRAFT_770908 [Macrolepiota fuliginosa MF-IS2]